VRVLAGAGLLALGAATAAAEEDHLIGVKVKDDTPPPNATHAYTTTAPPGWAGNCTLKKPQFYLTRGEGDGGDNPYGGPAGEYVCYKATCDEPPPATYPAVEDARGTHALEGKKVKLICLPAQPPAVCGNEVIEVGEDCDGASLGACLAGCEPDCSCTPPPPCPGFVVAGTCWVLGFAGDDCLATCGSAARAYDSATQTYAGSAGTLLNCGTLMSLFGGSPSSGSCPDGLGCAIATGFPFFDRHCTSPATTATANHINYQRICGCLE
jgi:hypothetical protein